jgi:tetratricopeptide (TPR) repeat protein
MIDFATTLGMDNPKFFPDDGPRLLDRPAIAPTMWSGTASFDDEDFGLHDVPSPYAGTAPNDHTAPVLDEIVARSRRDVAHAPWSARARTNLALALINAGDFEAAGDALSVALELQPGFYLAVATRARLMAATGRHEEARQCFRRLLDQRPGDSNALIGLADVAEREGNVEEAIRLWREVGAIQPKSPWPLYSLGIDLLSLRRHHEAINVFRRAVRLEPRRAILHHGLGVAYAMAGGHQRAVRSFRSALALAPGLTDATRGLVLALLEGGAPAEAAIVAEEHLRRVPADSEARELLAAAHAHLGNFAVARSHLFKLHEALLSEPSSDHSDRLAIVLNNLGVCYWQLNQLEEAKRRFAASIGLHPPVSAAHLNLARLSLVLERPDEAVAVARHGVQRFPKDEELRVVLAYALAKSKRFPAAVDEMRTWVHGGEASADAWAFLGYLLVDAVKAPSEASDLLYEAHERFPNSIPVVNNLAYALLVQDRVDEAREVLGAFPPSAAAPRFGGPEIALLATWGLLSLKLGDMEQARERYELAASAAEALKMRRMARTVKQKMHLEFAQAYRARGETEAALAETRMGLDIHFGDDLYFYRSDLEELAASLRGEMRTLAAPRNGQT